MTINNRFLVTGGAGFIGANLVRDLLSSRAQVRVLDDFSTGRWENLAEVEADIEVQEGDVRDLRALRRSAEGTRAIVHLAALPRTLPDQDETRMLDVNVKGTLCALMVARELHLPLVFASSSAVYGARDACLLYEKMPPEARTPLGTQKLACESYCRLFWESHSTRTVVLRIFNAFGPFEDPQAPAASVVARFAAAMVRGNTPVIFGDGAQTRDFVYVANVCDAIARAVRAVDAGGGVFNVGSGDSVAIKLLYNHLAELTGFRRAPVMAAARPGDLRHLRAALGHTTSVLRYAPRVRLRQGLEDTVAWHRQELERTKRAQWFSPSPPAVHQPVVHDADDDAEVDEIPIYEVEEVSA
jgi:UDP-glucose 4-epimerase